MSAFIRFMHFAEPGDECARVMLTSFFFLFGLICKRLKNENPRRHSQAPPQDVHECSYMGIFRIKTILDTAGVS